MNHISFCILLAVSVLIAGNTGSGSVREQYTSFSLLRSGDVPDDVDPISDYDEVIRRVGSREGYDWRFLAAIAYHESRFEADVVSSRGAMGLMQIMPGTARQFNVGRDRIMDPFTNVTVAARLLTLIESSLRIPSGVSDQDRLRIMLASYNGGIGHVSDARRLVRKYGGDPNKWNDVARFLADKGDYADDEAVRCGVFYGGETLAFVDNVMGKYQSYCKRCPI